jgi:hypothetical protein
MSFLGSISDAVIVSSTPTTTIDNDDVNVPTFSMNDLLTGRRLDELSVVLSTTGLLAVVLEHDDDNVKNSYADNFEDNDVDENVAALALQGLCRCASDNTESFLSMDGTDTITLLADDDDDDDTGGMMMTTRTTLATATAGTTPLPLPDSLADHCGLDTAKSMETLRDQVAAVSDAFIFALDQLLLGGGDESAAAAHRLLPLQQQQRPLLSNWDGGSYSSIADIRNGANHLEHFHVYHKKASSFEDEFITTPNDDDNKDHHQESSSRTSTTLDWHTDAGLFLAFVPAINCNHDNTNKHEHERDHSFWFMENSKNTQQAPIRAIFPTGSIAIMLGAGAEHWLDTSSRMSLKATKHAVKMQSGDARAWYGMSK